MAAYYNEHDKFAAQWLRNLIAAGHIADGEVDERDIKDVIPSELSRFTQCHFFAGIGVWSYALRQAGWPDDRQVWTGSCPCQPFSAAGRGDGFTDERHLWPHWFHLIRQCKPGVVFGEQVAARDGLAWLDLVCSDMEGEGFTVGALDLCAAGFGAPGKRQRSFFVAHAHADADGRGTPTVDQCDDKEYNAQSRGEFGGMAHTNGKRFQGKRPDCDTQGRQGQDVSASGLCDGTGIDARTVADTACIKCEGRICGCGQNTCTQIGRPTAEPSRLCKTRGAVNGFWKDAEWVKCSDEKYRPIEPGSFPLAYGAPARMGRLRGYGNAINAQVATGFIRGFMDITGD